jgi:hypothetical protein
MREIKSRLGNWAGAAGIALAALCALLILVPTVSAQTKGPTAKGYANAQVLPPGGPTPRTADRHPDFTGRYYPNRAGRMIDSATPGRVDPAIRVRFDPKVTPQENEVFKPETKAKYQFPTPYGICAPGGTPTSITTQYTEQGPFEMIQLPGKVWIMTEFPLSVRYIPTDGRPHSKDPDVSFNGESIGHWEGDTLVVDTIAIDTRMRNISVGATGDANAWTHSEQEHVIERFSRPSKNYLTYQVSIEDPVVLAKPYSSAPHVWTLAQGADDTWTEFLCTNDEEPDSWKNIDPQFKKEYETGTGRFAPGAGRGGQ